MTFEGAKAALFIGTHLLVIRRDDRPGLRWAGFLDFPGGGREGAETPEQTLIRETREEVGLDAARADWLWRMRGPAAHDPAAIVWFFVLRLPPGAEAGIVFGDEGQGWHLMPPAEFLTRRDAVPSLQTRLRLWLDRAT